MDAIPGMMKAAVVKRKAGQFTFEILMVPTPEPGRSEILVRLTASGICGTDIALASGEMGDTRDILGHEGVGYVVKVGNVVSERDVHIGDRIGIAWLRDICGRRIFCMHPGGETRCKEQMNSGRKVNGTFAEYALVPTRYIIRLPETPSVMDEIIASILCGGVTAYAALKACGAFGGQWVAISGGGGGVGALAIQYAKAMCYRVIAIDAGVEKGEFCLHMGAGTYLDVVIKDLAKEVELITAGEFVHAALVCAGQADAYNSALDILAPFGTLVCIGIGPPSQNASFHPLQFIDKGIKIVGSAVGTKKDIADTVGLVKRGLVKRGLVTPPTIPIVLEDLPEVVRAFGKETGKFVIRFQAAVNKGQTK